MLSLRIYFLKDKTVIATSLIALIAIAGSWFLLSAVPKPAADDPLFVILQYTIYFGNQRVGMWSSLFLIPIVSTVLVLMQIVGAYFLYERERFWSYVLMVASALVSILFFLGSLFLLTINV